MKSFPRKCLLDTNVPKTANLAAAPAEIPTELISCVSVCVDVVYQIVRRGGLVLDAGDEIFDEYRRQLRMEGQPGVGDQFMKWVHDNRWTFPVADRVTITRKGDSYVEFPDHPDLAQFDNSDRKFIAVSNAHPDKPPVLQATDSKWWGWKDALAEVGIAVHFLCPDYAEAKYTEKMGE
jgi:hypothetical protein